MNRFAKRAATAAGVTLLAVGLTACGSSPPSSPVASGPSAVGAPPVATNSPPWPRPDNEAARITVADLPIYEQEIVTVHYHAHLDVLIDGAPVSVPAELGIVSDGIAPLHTHDTSGVIHIESKQDVPYTLGQFFTEWGVRLTTDCVGDACASGDTQFGVYVNGKRQSGDPGDIVLKAHNEVAIVVGNAAQQAAAPSTYTFRPGL